MDFSLYKKIIDSFPNSKEVQPQFFGEPLLYPKIIEKNILSQKREVIYESGNDWMYFWIFSNIYWHWSVVFNKCFFGFNSVFEKLHMK